MKENLNIVKSKRLKFIRGLMYLDALMLLWSLVSIDVREFSWKIHSGLCLRILILVILFGLFFAAEKSLSRYIRKHRNEK